MYLTFEEQDFSYRNAEQKFLCEALHYLKTLWAQEKVEEKGVLGGWVLVFRHLCPGLEQEPCSTS